MTFGPTGRKTLLCQHQDLGQLKHVIAFVNNEDNTLCVWCIINICSSISVLGGKEEKYTASSQMQITIVSSVLDEGIHRLRDSLRNVSEFNVALGEFSYLLAVFSHSQQGGKIFELIVEHNKL